MSQNVYVRTNKQASKQTNKQTHKHTNTQTYKHTYIQPASQPARQAGRQAGRQTDRQTDRHTYIHTYNNTSIHQYIIFHQQTHLVASSEGFSHCHGRCSSATAQLPESWSWSSMAQWMPGSLTFDAFIYIYIWNVARTGMPLWSGLPQNALHLWPLAVLCLFLPEAAGHTSQWSRSKFPSPTRNCVLTWWMHFISNGTWWDCGIERIWQLGVTDGEARPLQQSGRNTFSSMRTTWALCDQFLPQDIGVVGHQHQVEIFKTWATTQHLGEGLWHNRGKPRASGKCVVDFNHFLLVVCGSISRQHCLRVFGTLLALDLLDATMKWRTWLCPWVWRFWKNIWYIWVVKTLDPIILGRWSNIHLPAILICFGVDAGKKVLTHTHQLSFLPTGHNTICRTAQVPETRARRARVGAVFGASWSAFPRSLHSHDWRWQHLRLWNMLVVASTEIKMSMWEKLVSKGSRADLDGFSMCILDDSWRYRNLIGNIEHGLFRLFWCMTWLRVSLNVSLDVSLISV